MNLLPLSVLLAPVTIYVLAFVIVALVLGFMFVILKGATSRASGVRHGTAITGDFAVLPPQTLITPTPVIYQIVQQPYTQYGLGQPVLTGNPIALPGVPVTFSTSGINSTVNGKASETIITDANGNAVVMVAPLQNADDTVKVSFEINYKTYGDTSMRFETVKP